MNSVSTNFTVADYCKSMERSEIIVNKEYQRSDQVWPTIARSYLIETILKGFPIPKLYLHQKTDVKSKRTYKEIVDGQQRSAAILSFYKDEWPISKSAEDEDIRGRKYSALNDEYKQRFLEYGINVDLFVSATTEEVIEVFRRMNSYTVPLNPEEQRHALYQGEFKWFVNELAERLNALFLQTGIFKEKQLVRMADNKLITELADSFLNGIRTTDKNILDSLYREFDDKFPGRKEIYGRLTDAFNAIRRAEEIQDTVLTKPHMAYSLAQAITHTIKPVKKFTKIIKSPQLLRIDWGQALPNLTALAQAADSDDPRGRFRKFAQASQEKTNVKKTREIRFKWMCKALSSEII